MQYKQFNELKDGDKFSTELIPNNVFVKVYGQNRGCSINSGLIFEFRPDQKVKTGINIEISPEQESKAINSLIQDTTIYLDCSITEFKKEVKEHVDNYDCYLDQITYPRTNVIEAQWYRFFYKYTNKEIASWSNSFNMCGLLGTGEFWNKPRMWDDKSMDNLIRIAN